MVRFAPRSTLDVAIDHYDALGVLAYLDQKDASAAAKERAHDWLQSKFDSIAPAVQELYMDRIISIVRWGRVRNPSDARHLRAWLAQPRAYEMTFRQLTDYHIMMHHQIKVSWCSWLTSLFLCQ